MNEQNQPINLALFRKDTKLIGYRVSLVARGGECQRRWTSEEIGLKVATFQLQF